MTIGSVIHAITFLSCPHVGHTSGSTSNTRFTSRRQADRRFASGEPLCAGVTGSAGVEAGSAAAPSASSPTHAPTAAPFAALTVARIRWLKPP